MSNRFLQSENDDVNLYNGTQSLYLSSVRTSNLTAENLTLSGSTTLTSGSNIADFTFTNGNIICGGGTINFNNENLTTTGTIDSGNQTITGSSIPRLTIRNTTPASLDDEKWVYNVNGNGSLLIGPHNDAGGSVSAITLDRTSFTTNLHTYKSDQYSWENSSAVGTEWLNLSNSGLLVKNDITLTTGSITSASGTISFGSDKVLTTGNVGIGTNNPLDKLSLSGSFTYMRAEGGDDYFGYYGGGNSNSGTGATNPWFASLSGSNGDAETIATSTTGWLWYNRNDNGNLELARRNNTTTDAQVMTFVRSSGNVGIGTNNPAIGLTIGSSTSRKTWSTFAYKDSAHSYPPTLGLSQTIFSGIINSAGGTLYFYARNDTDSYYYTITNAGTLFTGQHSGTGNPTLLKAGENEGLIVECDGTYVDKIEINNSWVNVKLTSTNKSPRVYGVISTHSAEEELSDENNVYKDHEQHNWGNDINENQIRVNSLGEGAIWVSNLNGNFSNGDFIVSTTIKGYGGKQDDDILHNYTIGKVLSDCDFTNNNYKKRYLTSEGIQITEKEYDENIHYIACFIGCVYYCG